MTDRTKHFLTTDLIPIPRSVTIGDGAFITLEDGLKLTLQIPETAGAEKILNDDAFLFWKIRFDIVCEPLAETLPAEGYDLEIREDQTILLKAADLAGARYALRTMRQLAIPERGVRASSRQILPPAKIVDSPDLAFRGVHICWFPETRVFEVEKMIRLAAYYKYNYIVLEPWGVFPFECAPFIGWKEKMVPRAEFKRLIALAKSFGITMIPQINLNGHASMSRGMTDKHAVLNFAPEYSPLFEPSGWCWCLTNPESRKVLTEMVEEIHDFFGRPPYFHAGCDEAYDMASCPSCAEHTPADLLQDHLVYFNDLIKSRGARMMIWHDMLLPRNADWEGYVACATPENGTADLYKTLPRDIIICDWQYCGCVPARDPDFEWASSKFFMDAGFETMLCPWDNPPNMISQGRYMAKNGGFGLLETTWHTCKSNAFLDMFRTGAIGSWSALNPEGSKYLWNRHNEARYLRQIDTDMGTEHYEETGKLVDYQIPPFRWQG